MMAFLLIIVAFAVLFAVSWPIALLLMVLVPFLWVLSIPFRIVGIVLEAVLGDSADLAHSCEDPRVQVVRTLR